MGRGFRIEQLEISDAVAEKIETKHGVRPDEVEEALFDEPNYVRRAKQGLYLVYGRTAAGRYLFIVIALVARSARLITARGMAPKERRFYGKQGKR